MLAALWLSMTILPHRVHCQHTETVCGTVVAVWRFGLWMRVIVYVFWVSRPVAARVR